MKSIIRFFEENVEKYSTNIYLWEKLQEKYEGQRVMNERIAAERSAQAQQSQPTDQGDQP